MQWVITQAFGNENAHYIILFMDFMEKKDFIKFNSFSSVSIVS